MPLNILDHLTLAYQPVWGRSRQLVAVRLRVHALQPESVDASRLMQLIGSEWTSESPVMILSMDQAPLLAQALASDPVPGVWVECPDMSDQPWEMLNDQVVAARQRGLRVLRAGRLGAAVLPPAMADDALQARQEALPDLMLDIWPEDAQRALAAGEAAAPATFASDSPILPAQAYQNVATLALASHCLDQQLAWGVCVWPVQDALRRLGAKAAQPDRATIDRVRAALDAESALEVVEHEMLEDPILTYRLLQWVKQALANSEREVRTLRQALMMMGQQQCRHWLGQQSEGASTEADLWPVRQAMVLRARIMETLMDPGPQDELRAEIYFTGLLSQIDRLLRQPLHDVLESVSMSERVTQALELWQGPYFEYLDIARRLEQFDQVEELPAILQAHEFRLDEVNRALIRTLAHSRTA